MLVDDIGDVTITNDGATILKMLEVEHPAAKVLVELAELQDREVGDGTTSVVIVAAELLKRANDLVRNKIHPTIINGFRCLLLFVKQLAMREACKYIVEKLTVKVEKLGKDSLMNCAKTSMSSKLIATDDDFFVKLNLLVPSTLTLCTDPYPTAPVQKPEEPEPFPTAPAQKPEEAMPFPTALVQKLEQPDPSPAPPVRNPEEAVVMSDELKDVSSKVSNGEETAAGDADEEMTDAEAETEPEAEAEQYEDAMNTDTEMREEKPTETPETETEAKTSTEGDP